ncbi:MAG: MoaD/ThiS family protein [Betaproteobacteria bacterium]
MGDSVIDVVYLARLREAFGSPGERVALATHEGATVSDVLAQLRERGGVFATELAAGRAFRVAVNHTMASRDTAVRPGDELALFPPVTGG